MNSVELTQFANLLIDYSRSASGALGASFYDIGRYESAKASNMMRKIAEKVGVEFKYSGNRSGNGFNFDNSENLSAPTNHSGNSGARKFDNIEDLENELG